MPLRVTTGIPIRTARVARAAVAAAPILDVPFVAQEQTQWCWAACAEMVAAFLDKPPVRQCELANFLHRQRTCCATPGSDRCNRPCPLEGFPAVYDHLGIPCITNTWPVSAAVVVRELTINRPVEVGYLWYGGGGHVAIVYGVTAAGRFAVHDPWYGSGSCTYEQLYFAYGLGRWAFTFGGFH
jgi:hypothetical protein